MILALGLGAAIGGERIARIIGEVGALRCTVEDEVGRHMDEPAARPGHRLDHRRHCIGIDRAGKRLVGLGLVDRGVGGGVDDQFGCLDHQSRREHRQVGEIAVVDVDCVDIGPTWRGPLKRAAKLAVGAGDQHSHANTDTSASESPRASFSEMIGSSPASGHSIPTIGSFHASVCSLCGA